MTKSVGVILYFNNKYLIQKRSKKKNIYFPNMYGLFGGGLNKNENFLSGVYRELYEELSLKCTIKCLLHSPGTLLSPWNNKLYTPIYYYIQTIGNILVPENENITIDFLFPKEILIKNNVAEPEKKALKNLLEMNII